MKQLEQTLRVFVAVLMVGGLLGVMMISSAPDASVNTTAAGRQTDASNGGGATGTGDDAAAGRQPNTGADGLGAGPAAPDEGSGTVPGSVRTERAPAKPSGGDHGLETGGSDHDRQCAERFKNAKTDDERMAIARQCGAGGSGSGSGGGGEYPRQKPVAQDEHYEAATWSELAAWWPHRPMLRPSAPPTGTKEHTYAWSRAGGRKADPKTDRETTATAVYDTPAKTVDNADAMQIVMAGGWQFGHISPDAAKQFQSQSGGRQVDIGRAKATEWEFEFQPGQGVRFTYWTEQNSGFLILSSKHLHTSADVRRFAESLRNV